MYVYDNQDDEGEDLNSLYSEKVLIADPFEPVNRHIFNINSIIDSGLISPVIETYIAVTPKHLRKNVGNFVSNMGEPINFINLMLQGNFSQARVTFGRFITNTLLGFFGIMDVASGFNMPYKGEDFGQTLAHYGFPTGPYLVMPIFGSSSTRDTTGKVFDFFANPIRYTLDSDERIIVNVAWLVHKRTQANGVIKTVKRSLDPYETAKMLYIQNRIKLINDAK
jgi:phospholipid-binding lipoprotein MlaA